MVACARAPVAIETPKASGQTKESTGLPAFFQIRDQAGWLFYGGLWRPTGDGQGTLPVYSPPQGRCGDCNESFSLTFSYRGPNNALHQGGYPWDRQLSTYGHLWLVKLASHQRCLVPAGISAGPLSPLPVRTLFLYAVLEWKKMCLALALELHMEAVGINMDCW